MVLAHILHHQLDYALRVQQLPLQVQDHLHGHVMAQMADQTHHVLLRCGQMVHVVHHIMVISIQLQPRDYVLREQPLPLAVQAHGHGHVLEQMAV